MNKTISVNIGGRVFNIEEVAFEHLNQYINTIRRVFGSEDGAEEIISDIELRIAELFLERITPSKQVVTLNDVKEVIAIMGRPEEFAGAESDGEGNSQRDEAQRKASRRVFRDPDNKVIFGVCSGVSAYFGWDPIVLRILFVIAFFGFGIGLIPYIILAVIIPKAKTTAEKLQMRGEPVTVENISKKVSESFEDLQDDLKDFGKKNDINEARLRREGERFGSFFERLGQFIVNVLGLIFTILAKVIGVAIFFAMLLAIVVLAGLFLGWDMGFVMNDGGAFWDHKFFKILDGLFTYGNYKTIFMWGLAAVLFIPLAGLLWTGIRLTFDAPKMPVYVGIVLSVFWFAGLTAVFFGGRNTLSEFNVSASYPEEIAMQLSENRMVTIHSEETGTAKYTIKRGFNKKKMETFHSSVTFPGLDSTDILYTGRNSITVAMNDNDSLFRLELERSARGATQKDAIHNASAILTHHTIAGDTLNLYPWFALTKDHKIRSQKAKYTLYVPVGGKVHLSHASKAVIDDVPNITNTYDADMVGETWIMTRNGLACESCIEETPLSP